MPTYKDPMTGKTYKSQTELTPDELDEIFSSGGQQTQKQPTINNPFSVLQPGIKQTAQDFSTGHWGAGLADFANTVLQVPGVGIEAIRQGYHNPAGMAIDQLTGQPIFGTMNKAVVGAADLAGQGLGWLADKAVGMTLPGNNVYKPLGALTPSFLEVKIPEQYTPEYNSVKNLGTTGATYAIGAGIPEAGALLKKAGAKALYGVTPSPEAVISPAAKLSAIDEEAAAARYMVANKKGMGGRYSVQQGKVDVERANVKNIVDQELAPRLQAIENGGELFSRQQIGNNAYQYAKGKISPNTAQGVADLKILDKIHKEFMEGGDPYIKPTDLQKAKTEIQSQAPFDREGTVRQIYDKGIAHEARTGLETFDPGLKRINEKLHSAAITLDRMEYNAGKTGKSLPTGEAGLPFYITISNPIKGLAAGAGKNLLANPMLRSKIAFALDNLRTVAGKGLPEQPTSPGYTRPPNAGLLPAFTGFDEGVYNVPFSQKALPYPRDMGFGGENKMTVTTGNPFGAQPLIPPMYKLKIAEKLGVDPRMNDLQMIQLAKERGLFDNAPMDEAPLNMGGTMERGKTQQDMFNEWMRQGKIK
jgi:hypothetical protein